MKRQKNRILRLLSILIVTIIVSTYSITTVVNAQSLAEGNMYYKNSIINEGDYRRIAATMKKAASGKDITIGVIGGSVTAGANSTDYAKLSWGALVRDWWQKRFPKIKVSFVNAGVGATDSIFGVHRLDTDLLSHNPDFVVVEFSVNDMGTENVDESYEGLMRRVLDSKNKPGVMALAICENKGQNVQNTHLPICKNYGVPYLSYRDAYFPYVQSGAIKWTDISSDEVHPTDYGHSLMAGLVTQYLDNVYKIHSTASKPNLNLPEPVTANRFQDAAVYNNKNITPKSMGSFNNFNANFWGNGFRATSKGDPLVFEIEANSLYINYKRSTSGGGNAYIVVDGGKPIKLSADFSGGWGGYMAKEKIFLLSDKTPKKHKVEIHFDDSRSGREFVISSLLVADKGSGFEPTVTKPTTTTGPSGGTNPTSPSGKSPTTSKGGTFPTNSGGSITSSGSTDPADPADPTDGETDITDDTDNNMQTGETQKSVVYVRSYNDKIISQTTPTNGTVTLLIVIVSIVGGLTLAVAAGAVVFIVKMKKKKKQ